MSQEKPKHVAILYKSKLNLEQATKARRGMRYKGLPFFFVLSAKLGGWSTSRSGRFTPGIDPVPIVWEAVWATGPVWTMRKILTVAGFDPRNVQPVASRCTD